MQQKCVRLTAFATAPLCRNFPSLKRKKKKEKREKKRRGKDNTHQEFVHLTTFVAASLFRSFPSLIKKKKKQKQSNKTHQKCVCQHCIASLFPPFFPFRKR